MGKLLIAVGEWLFGLNSFGWRFASAVFGSLAILLICRIARRMTRSTLLGCIAGLLMSLDGLEFVLSRSGILDIFLMFFVLAAFGCILIDRDVSRAQLAERVARREGGHLGPRFGIRRWRVAAGVFLGLAVATKWNAAWYILGFAALITAWDIGARRAAGLRSFARGGLRETRWLPVTFLAIPLAVYIASWSGWFATSTGYYRDFAQTHGVHTPVISALYSLYEYHLQAISFGMGLKTPHPYQSQPWDWLLVTRPVAFFYECYTGPVGGPSHYCPSGYKGAEWSQEVLALGTPAIWWGSMLALLFCLGWWLLHRDWRAGAVLLGVLAGWGALVPARVPDQVLLLRAGVRAVPDLVHRALPGADPRAGRGQRAAPVDRRSHRRRLRVVRAAHVLVLLFDSGRFGDPLSRLVQPHVVPDRPGLDLGPERAGFTAAPSETPPGLAAASSHPLRRLSGFVQLDVGIICLRR